MAPYRDRQSAALLAADWFFRADPRIHTRCGTLADHFVEVAERVLVCTVLTGMPDRQLPRVHRRAAIRNPSVRRAPE